MPATPRSIDVAHTATQRQAELLIAEIVSEIGTAFGGIFDGSTCTRRSGRCGFQATRSPVSFQSFARAAAFRRNAAAIRRCHRDRYSGSPRFAAIRPLPSLVDRRARHHLGPRRPRSNACRLAFRRTDATLRPRIEHFADRPRRQLLSVWGGAGRFRFRLAHRSPGAQEAILDHACGLPSGHRRHRIVLECLEFRAIPFPHRRRHRRRIHCHQFDNPGAYPCTPARLD